MENYKVCILAAGIGSRSFDPNINKSLLPLDGKAVISNIINKFEQNQKFVIALGYLSDQVKQYLLHAHPKTKFEFVMIKKYFGFGGLRLSYLLRTIHGNFTLASMSAYHHHVYTT